MEFGVFEAVPASGSIGIKELVAKCEAEETLIGVFHANSLKGKPETLLTFSSPTDETAHMCRHIQRGEAFRMVTHSAVSHNEHSCWVYGKVLLSNLVRDFRVTDLAPTPPLQTAFLLTYPTPIPYRA